MNIFTGAQYLGPVCLALNLLVEAAGKEVTLEYEGLLAASDVLSVLGIAYKIDIRGAGPTLFQHPKNSFPPPGTCGGGGEVCTG